MGAETLGRGHGARETVTALNERGEIACRTSAGYPLRTGLMNVSCHYIMLTLSSVIPFLAVVIFCSYVAPPLLEVCSHSGVCSVPSSAHLFGDDKGLEPPHHESNVFFFCLVVFCHRFPGPVNTPHPPNLLNWARRSKSFFRYDSFC